MWGDWAGIKCGQEREKVVLQLAQRLWQHRLLELSEC